MKLKAISLLVLLFAGNAAASSVKLVCAVVGTSCSGTGPDNTTCWESNGTHQIHLDEEAGTLKWKGSGKWKTAKKVKFGDTEISGKLSGSLSSLGASHTIKLDRITGRMEYHRLGYVDWSGPCEVVDETKRAF